MLANIIAESPNLTYLNIENQSGEEQDHINIDISEEQAFVTVTKNGNEIYQVERCKPTDHRQDRRTIRIEQDKFRALKK